MFTPHFSNTKALHFTLSYFFHINQLLTLHKTPSANFSTSQAILAFFSICPFILFKISEQELSSSKSHNHVGEAKYDAAYMATLSMHDARCGNLAWGTCLFCSGLVRISVLPMITCHRRTGLRSIHLLTCSHISATYVLRARCPCHLSKMFTFEVSPPPNDHIVGAGTMTILRKS